MSFKTLTVAFTLFRLFSSACGAQVQEGTAPPASPALPTSTAPATTRQAPSETALPPPSEPTVAPVDGATSTQVNVRSDPSTAAAVLGIIPADTRVEITGKDPGESWWQINYPQGIEGKGWVTAQYVVAANPDQIPVIGGAAGTEEGPVAVVQQQLNVRSGPGTGFNSLGTLNPQDVAALTGKDANGAWLQIDFQVGPEGKGWINAAFVQAQGVESLPIITEEGLIVGTGTPTVIPPTPTATIVPAWEDNDSSTSPVASVVFEPTGTQALIYHGDLSTPEGDAEDWIVFQPFDSFVMVSMDCQGNGSISVAVTEAGIPVETLIECNEPAIRIEVDAGSNYLLHLQAAPAVDGLQYVKYMLHVSTSR